MKIKLNDQKSPTAVMGQCISYILIYNRGHLLYGFSIFDGTVANLQQKL
jgi:hypothetical protein